MTIALPVYPGRDLLPGLAYSQKWTPQFYNQSAEAASGASISVGIAANPLHGFELTYRLLRDGVGPGFGPSNANLEFKTLFGFHLQIAGTRGRFLYRNVDDQTVWRQALGTGDGTTTTFPLIRTFGANGYGASEPIGAIDTTAQTNVWLGDAVTPTDPATYSFDTNVPGAQTIVFETAPAAGKTVAIDMSYFYYCRLADDSNTFEKFMARMWTVQKVGLMSCRPGA